MKIVDTHVHVWDLENYRLPWLDGEGPVLKRSYSPTDYLADSTASDGAWEVEGAVYIEVDMAPEERERENEMACGMVADTANVFGAACISGDLREAGFAEYIDTWGARPEVRGVRQVLHVPSAAPGTCLAPQFLENVRHLGECGLVFEACLRCPEIGDVVQVARECPDTQIVLNHMGIVDADIMAAVNPTADERAYQDAWKKNMRALGQLPNVTCKVSGLNPMGAWSTESLGRAVSVALESFDADKVMFASNYPVLKVALTFEEWMRAMLELTEGLSTANREALFAGNARRVYGM